MKRILLVLILGLFLVMTDANSAKAQCSICTKTAQQLGERPAKGLNAGIIYLMMAPLAIISVVGFRWWKQNKED